MWFNSPWRHTKSVDAVITKNIYYLIYRQGMQAGKLNYHAEHIKMFRIYNRTICICYIKLLFSIFQKIYESVENLFPIDIANNWMSFLLY